MSTKVLIRPMVKEDQPPATYIMACAFGQKMPAMSGSTNEVIADFLRAGGVFDETIFNHHYVALCDGKVVGIMHLETLLDQRHKKTPRKERLYLLRKFGFFRVMFSSVSLFFLDNKLSDDEMLVDYIAVHPNYRGQGIGSQLLDFGEEVAKASKDIKRYTLGVIDENISARRLYERKGFVVYKTKHSLVLEFFTGVKTSHKMEKLL